MSRREVRAVLGVAALSSVLAACTSGAAGDRSPADSPVPATSAVRSEQAAAAPVDQPATARLSVTKPKPNPCVSNKHGQLVRVSLRKQHLWMCDGTRLARSTPITSGIPGEYTSTPTGNYAIQGLNRNTVLTLITGDQYRVKYWIPFDAPLFGFHDSSWQDFPYGSQRYKKDGSHGCVHVPLRAIAFLYRWADIGTKVHIRA